METSSARGGSLATTGKELLRIYWYDGASESSGPSAEHLRIARCDDVKLRLGVLNAAGRQKGVDSLIVTDLIELARNNAISDAVLVSGDEDIRIGVVLAQSFGVRLHLVAINPGRGTQSRQLVHEADTCTELGLEVLKPLMSIQAEFATPAAALSAVAQEHRPQRPRIPAIDDVAAALVAPLGERERGRLVEHLRASHDIPREFDVLLLTRSPAALGRDLLGVEMSYARKRCRELLGGRG